MLRLVATRALSTAATTTPVSRAYLEASGKVNNPQHSNAEDLIAKVKTIYVQGSEAVCDGGGGALGHPVEARVHVEWGEADTPTTAVHSAGDTARQRGHVQILRTALYARFTRVG